MQTHNYAFLHFLKLFYRMNNKVTVGSLVLLKIFNFATQTLQVFHEGKRLGLPQSLAHSVHTVEKSPNNG